MRKLLSFLLLLVTAGPAAASGGLSCSSEEGGVLLILGGGVTHGMGSALFSFSGSAEIQDGQVEDDLRITNFEREHVAQYWLDARALKLVLYRERAGDAPHGFVELTIETEPGEEEGEFGGGYTLSVYDMTHAQNGEAKISTFTGPISCFAE